MKQSIPKISVIIPVHNRIRYVEEAIQSVARQTYPHYEVILVNDGSGVEVSRFLLGLCENYPFAQMLELDKNLGVSGARNRGVELAKGDYLHFLDDDDRIAPEHFQKAVDRLNASGCEVVIAEGEVFSEESGHAVKRQQSNFQYIKKKFGPHPTSHWSYFLVYCPPIHAMVFKRGLFDTFHFPEELSYGEDRWLWLEMKREEVKFETLKDVGAFYRLTSKTGKEIRSQIQFFEKLASADFLDDEPSKNYVFCILILLELRAGRLKKAIEYKIRALKDPWNFMKNLKYLMRLR